jgi:hypothetical protein
LFVGAGDRTQRRCIGNLEHDPEKGVPVFRKIMLKQDHWDDEKSSRSNIERPYCRSRSPQFCRAGVERWLQWMVK